MSEDHRICPNSPSDPEEKDKFYTDLHRLNQKVPADDKIIILGDFNARGHEAFWGGFQEEELIDCSKVDTNFSGKKSRVWRTCDREQLQSGRLADMSVALKQVFNKDKTFRPKRKFEPGTQRFELHKRAQASLNSGVDLRAAVQLPSGEDQNDWVAVHVVDFFNRINLIYGTICEFCTERSCPVMSGGPKYEYRWQDNVKYKKPTALPAPQYMNLLMDWIEVQINNENIFPTRASNLCVPALDTVQLNPCLSFTGKSRTGPRTQVYTHQGCVEGRINSCDLLVVLFHGQLGLLESKDPPQQSFFPAMQLPECTTASVVPPQE
ncbi:MOB kinase activator 3A [Willisornis vidua]|uniref:MOB kinase activator 3A n=1 Tax=Willisornis vidua TaxID=1566151 RepID=A0ABQ9DDY1_9PASS|nr:MOB kinase activator 3A [Willisornis vidua]